MRKDIEFVHIPVTISFNPTVTIGDLCIQRDQLPEEPDYLFAIGYIKEKGTEGYKLSEVSILKDHEYIDYLKDKGVIK